MAKFKIGNYQGIKIDCWTAKDLVGLHHLMKQEGSPNSENLFSEPVGGIKNRLKISIFLWRKSCASR